MTREKNGEIQMLKRTKRMGISLLLIVALIMGTASISFGASAAKYTYTNNQNGLEVFRMNIKDNTAVFNASPAADVRYVYIGHTDTGKIIKTKFRFNETSDGNPSGVCNGLIAVSPKAWLKFKAYGKSYDIPAYGYVNRNGKVIYSAKFIAASNFKNGKALVSYPKDGKIYTSVIDTKGNYIFTVENGQKSDPDCMGAEYIRIPTEDGQYLIYDYSGNFIAKTQRYNDYQFNSIGYSDVGVTKEVADTFKSAYGSNYKNVEYLGLNRFVCTNKSGDVILANSSNEQIANWGKVYNVKAGYLVNGKSLYYTFTKSGKNCIARSDGKIIISGKSGNVCHTAADTFMVTNTSGNKDQQIYNLNGKRVIRYNNAFPLVTFDADGTGTTFRTLDFWQPSQGKAVVYTTKKIKNTSTSTLRSLLRKVKTVPGSTYANAAYKRAVALSRKSSAPCVEVWGAEAFVRETI